MSLRILSWNINGLRSLKTDMKEFLTNLKADIICLQETKVTRDMLEEPQAIVDGYSSYFSFSRKRSGYSGVATFCSQRATPFAAQEGLSGLFQGELSHGRGEQTALPGTWTEEELKDLDSEGRAVITQHRIKDESGKEKELAIINVYCPRVDPEKPERRRFKLRFYELLRQRAAAIWAADSHVIILGDINTSHKRIDHCDPEKNEAFENRLERRYLDNFLKPLNNDHEKNPPQDIKQAEVCKAKENSDMRDSSGSHKGESDDLEQEEQFQLLASSTDFQVIDTFRYFHPLKEEAFTCWNVSTNSRSTNYGTRIDYIFCDEGFLSHVKDSLVLQDIWGSDHCPVAVVVEGILVPSSQLPLCCTKYFPEFRGQQQKLSSYFQPRCASEKQNKLPLHKPSMPLKATTENLQNAIKRKNCTGKVKSGNKKQCSEKHRSISSFFSVKASGQIDLSEGFINDGESNSESRVSENLDSTPASLGSSEHTDDSRPQPDGGSQGSSHSPPSQSNKEDTTEGCRKLGETKNQGWGFLMKGPKPPPLCPGHKEPCVMQTVKKKGPNLNRQFYACARGVGREGDPNARCNFFKWVSR
ncbi:DNA-(apurinic or apyrimidinic site) lyase 2 [Chionoecetes opilio]|uniref:DNA-(apurinic or apyrimidinic site) endonuclease 2 n=1 Tax=Chionoecetes opilio TaxID=41210 RepID=A0A8J4YHF7_CHIOP|nr:DNA-(apurinic or apyrimidinic site) lyase 2 [Chionoecetes opilio]